MDFEQCAEKAWLLKRGEGWGRVLRAEIDEMRD
ncbi:hypothetical protein B0813_000294 [Candidatus Fervidibacteria bacterium JGI MDM2 SSWTFF-3-K9]